MTIKADIHGLTVQAARPFLSQNLTIGAASVPSAVFKTLPEAGKYTQAGVPVELSPIENHTLHIRVVATSACWISFGTAPVAISSGTASIYLPAGLPEYFWVYPGEKVAVIQDTAAGVLNICELQM